MGLAAGLAARAPSIDSSYFSLPVLLASNLRSPSRLQSLAPSALYGASSSFARPSGLLQLGFSGRQQQQRACGVARGMAGSDLESWVKKTNAKEPVVVYSKTWCPYCMRVKKLLGSLGYDFQVIELDEGGQPGLEDALTRVSGQYTVPNVFIGGKHIGGCDDTVALHSRGQLEPLLQAAGAHKN
jgi:glutaredoxin